MTTLPLPTYHRKEYKCFGTGKNFYKSFFCQGSQQHFTIHTKAVIRDSLQIKSPENWSDLNQNANDAK
jgi:hypothetical protein